LEEEISDNGSSNYCWWWCYNNGYVGTSCYSLLQMNLYGLYLLTESAMNSKSQHFVLLSSYTGSVECSSHYWKQFMLKKLLQLVHIKMNRFVARKCNSENDIKQKPCTSRSKLSNILKNRCTVVINVSSVF
jgi:hypothetical protein